MLIAILVYLGIGVLVIFGLVREGIFELVKEDSLAMKIVWISFFVLQAPPAFVYGFIREVLKNRKSRRS